MFVVRCAWHRPAPIELRRTDDGAPSTTYSDGMCADCSDRVRAEAGLSAKGKERGMIRVRDLRSGDNGAGKPFLLCGKCHGRYSADRGDYFMLKPDTIMRCCGRPLTRMAEQCTLVHT